MRVPNSTREGRRLGASRPEDDRADVSSAQGSQPDVSFGQAAEPESSIRLLAHPAPSTEPLLEIEVRSDEDLAALHRRSRQIAALMDFDTGQQTQIGTAVAVLTRASLTRTAAGKVEFFVVPGAPGTLSIRIEDLGPAKPSFPPDLDEDQAIRIARDLMDRVQIQLSPSGFRTALLRRQLPGTVPLDSERIHQVREALARAVPKSLVQELLEQNRELREIHQQLVLSELSLRQRIRQGALMVEASAVLTGNESMATKLPRCAEEVVRQLDIECALICTADPTGKQLTLAASAGSSSEDLPAQAELGNSPLGLIARGGKPFATNSVLNDPLTGNWGWATRERIQAFAGYPLAIGDKLIGVLAVYARRSLALDALDTLQVVASQLAVGIERQQRMEERERLLASEHEARVKAERAIQSREKLLAVVSHDLRNPLSSVVTAAALLNGSPALAAEPRFRKHVDAILHASDRMKRLLLDLVDLAGLESGRLALNPARQSVAPLVSESLQLHSPMAEAKSIRLESAVDDFLPEILCDHGRILQVLSNLIANAIKFTPEGGAISVRAFRAGGNVAFAVSDTGPGMSEQELAHVFEPYWQASPSRGQGGGLGLGLSIAKGLVEAQGGRIWVESTLGKGSTFVVSLPAQSELPASEQHLAHSPL